MNNRELAEYCIRNSRRDKYGNFYEDDFRGWDVSELCVSYFLQCKFLEYNFILNAGRCNICKNYVKYGEPCYYCEKGVVL